MKWRCLHTVMLLSMGRRHLLPEVWEVVVMPLLVMRGNEIHLRQGSVYVHRFSNPKDVSDR